MVTTRYNRGKPKKLTLRRVREICSYKAFKLGREYYDQDVVSDLKLKEDGALTGTVLGPDDTAVENIAFFISYPLKEHHATVSLQTGRWRCSCLYSQANVCSHAVALLICAAKDLKATVPAGDLPVYRRLAKRTTLPYRKEALRILTRADSVKSIEADLNEFLKLVDSCELEGDNSEALLVCLGVTEALLFGLDYQAYSGHLVDPPMSVGRVPPSVREPEDMDAMRIRKFHDVASIVPRLMSYTRIQHEQKIPCITAMHRLFLMTNPWGPSDSYFLFLILISKTDKDWEFLRRLHDPVVPDLTPDVKEGKVGFKAVMNLARLQTWVYGELQDDSLLNSYAQRYRDDLGTCLRYIQCMHRMKSGDERAMLDEARRLFPDTELWNMPGSNSTLFNIF